MKNRGKHTDFNKLSRGPPKEHPHKLSSKSMQQFERSRKTKKVHKIIIYYKTIIYTKAERHIFRRNIKDQEVDQQNWTRG